MLEAAKQRLGLEVVGVPEEHEETVAAFALADGVQDLVGDAFGPSARQGDEEATGCEVAAEGWHGHARTSLDFLLAREHARGAASHHRHGPAHFARGSGD